jgi:hypothetical protein
MQLFHFAMGGFLGFPGSLARFGLKTVEVGPCETKTTKTKLVRSGG